MASTCEKCRKASRATPETFLIFTERYTEVSESVVKAVLTGRLSFSWRIAGHFFSLHGMLHKNSADLFSSTACNFICLFIKAHLLLLNKNPSSTNQHFKRLVDFQSKSVETTVPKFHLFGTATILNWC